MIDRSILLVTCCILLFGCTPTPKPIAYGAIGCQFCSMIIVDKQHAAQFMTQKGKSYGFDATECMLNYLNGVDPSTIALFLVNDYNAPGETIDATNATYLMSKNIPSPMGEFLTAFSSKKAAEQAKAEHKGELFTWGELRTRFKK